MNEKAIRIATRSSELAMWQANWVKGRLEALGKSVELVPVLTQGDREQAAFRDMRGVGFFTKAVQDAVLSNKADLAVHSYKDLPSAQAPGLEIAAVSERADPRDVLLVRPEAFHPEDAPLPLMEGARVGTSAPRRQAQLRQLRPDLRVAELRGNVPSRIRKLREGEYDAVLLAAAGLARLGLEPADLRRHALTPEVFVPAPAQGVLALECRKGDFELASLLTDLHSPETYRMLLA
ncbi:MAG TPA: hydroxymethylbilane synthase, partial [Trueperaceae bacterium]